MAETITDRCETTQPSLAQELSSFLPGWTVLGRFILPKIEEHLLFERFLSWWRDRLGNSDVPIEPERHFTFFKVWDAFDQNECPICYLRRKARDLYLSNLWYENVNDVGLRNQLHRSLGFSPEAANTSVAMGEDLGISIIYRSLSEDVASRLHSGAKLAAEEPCPASAHASTMEDIYVQTLAAHYLAQDVQKRHEDSPGLCLNHIAAVLDALPTAELRKRFSGIEETKFRQLSQELDTFINKSDYRNTEPLGSEKDAWMRAPRKLYRQEPSKT
jgi:hypothetical protein